MDCAWLRAGLAHVPSTLVGAVLGSVAVLAFFHDATSLQALAVQLGAWEQVFDALNNVTIKVGLLAGSVLAVIYRPWRRPGGDQ